METIEERALTTAEVLERLKICRSTFVKLQKDPNYPLRPIQTNPVRYSPYVLRRILTGEAQTEKATVNYEEIVMSRLNNNG